MPLNRIFCRKPSLRFWTAVLQIAMFCTATILFWVGCDNLKVKNWAESATAFIVGAIAFGLEVWACRTGNAAPSNKKGKP